MYAIIKTGGKQYRVEVNATIEIEKIPGLEEGDQVTFDRVLLVSNGDRPQVGTPYLENTAVEGEVLEKGKRDKVTVYKYKKRKGYRKKKGHRQPYMKVQVNSIDSSE